MVPWWPPVRFMVCRPKMTSHPIPTLYHIGILLLHCQELQECVFKIFSCTQGKVASLPFPLGCSANEVDDQF
eukprot:1157253-Pelagomonas_calceolata.AAC.6